jgi:hypothetical protein
VIEMIQYLFDAHCVHLAAVVIAGLYDLLDVTSRNLSGKRIGDYVASALFLLYPCMAGHGDPHRTAADVKPDIDSVGVASRNGDDVPDPAAVQIRAGPAILHLKVFVHGNLKPNRPPSRHQVKNCGRRQASVTHIPQEIAFSDETFAAHLPSKLFELIAKE